MHRSAVSSLLSLTAMAALVSLAPAQTDGPYWSTYPIPASVTRFSALGKLGVAETPTAIHLYSGLHRAWTVLPVATPTVSGPTNTYVLVRDGNVVHGFSAYSGQVSSLPVSSTATINIGSVASSWTAYVQDGSTIYGWSGFYGQWVPLQLQGSLQAIGIGSHMIQVADSQNVYAFSAFFGTWVTEPTRSGANYITFRNGGVVTYAGPDEVKAFSVYQNRWTSLPFPNAQSAVFDGRDAYALLNNAAGSDTVWFSTLTGNLIRRQSAGSVGFTMSPNCAVMTSAGGVTGYAPGVDGFVPLPAIGAGSLTLAQGSFGCYALIDDGLSLTAFNGLSGRVTTAPYYLPGYAYTLGDTAAFASGPLNLAFSALRDQWVLASSTPTITAVPMFEGIIRTVAGGYEGFSARTGTFATLATGPGLLVTQAQGTLTAYVTAAGGIDAFDPRLGRWVRQNTGPNPVFNTFRLTGVANDGVNGYGYSLFTNTWESIPLLGVAPSQAANSSVAYIRTNSHYHMFTGTGSLSNFSRFPEFSRFVARGAPLFHLQTGTPGTFVLGLFSFGQAENLTPFGLLRLDPSSLVTLGLGVIPAGGILRTPIQMPTSPVFNGLELHLQDLLISATGQVSLTNAQAPYIW